MKILHTSDWHLGRSLYGCRRYDEFTAFLDWLALEIEEEKIDLLLVSGDVFDTSTPGNRAQELYYHFLCRVSVSCCHDVVIIAGNHDSPSFLNAPKELLRTLNVHVVGSLTDNIEDEVILLGDLDQVAKEKKTPLGFLVCAVPYLRDRDIREVKEGESFEEKNKNLLEGIKKHYKEVSEVALKKREEVQLSPCQLPIIALGHLFTAGGKTAEGDGVRELYVGTLAHIGEESFPPCIDYLALGHLHVPQIVAGKGHIRYSGSPIPMGFGEAKQQKSIVIVDFTGEDKPEIRLKNIPCFQQLEKISGTLNEINVQLEELRLMGSKAWLEIEYTGKSPVSNLRELMEEAVKDSSMEIRRIKNKIAVDRILKQTTENETLDDLDVYDVFSRCLDAHEVPKEDQSWMTAAYGEMVKEIEERDINFK